MAAAMTLPTTHAPLKNVSLKRCRRASIESHERRIIEQIKNRFDLCRRQCQSHLSRKEEKFKKGSSVDVHKVENICNVNRLTRRDGIAEVDDRMETVDSVNRSHDSTVRSRSASVRIVDTYLVERELDSEDSSQTSVTTKTCPNAKSHDKMMLEVDISGYVPTGEVVFRPDPSGLVVCARNHSSPNSAQGCSRQFTSHEEFEKVKLIPVTGIVESERIKVRPGRNAGTVVVEICVQKQ